MKLAFSNIAWNDDEESAVANSLNRLGVSYVEIAPTKKWLDPTVASDDEIGEYLSFWSAHNLKIVAFQSMLYNRPDLKIFESEAIRQETLKHLKKFIELAEQMGAKVLVFGSPKNRQRGSMSKIEAARIATDFFTELGKHAKNHNVYFCIEPNPPAYGCDFITTAREGIDIVDLVNSEGFGLHLDMAGMVLAEDKIKESIREAEFRLKHFHISAPRLDEVRPGTGVPYEQAAEALKQIGYQNYVSIEMRPAKIGNLARVKRAVEFSKPVFN